MLDQKRKVGRLLYTQPMLISRAGTRIADQHGRSSFACLVFMMVYICDVAALHGTEGTGAAQFVSLLGVQEP